MSNDSDRISKGQNPQETRLQGGVMPQSNDLLRGVMPQPSGDLIIEGANPQSVTQPGAQPQGGVDPQVIPTTLSGGGKPPAHE